MSEPRELTLYQAAEQMRRGRLTAEALVHSCLERIEAREPTVQAWATLYAEAALAEARRCDAEGRRGHWRGPLHGLPLGIKDIFDVQGQETRAGTEAYVPRAAGADAASVARLRAAGAIVLGKTVTTSFAMGDPGPTRNPWQPDHTPGGSSSGSGAAVADRMCLGALGTQTAGSVIRPAAYNGIAGFKPSFGRISTEGVIALSYALDHVGCLARSVEDAHLLWSLMRDRDQPDYRLRSDRLLPALLPRRPARLWRVRGLFEDEAEPAMREAFDTAVRLFADKGVEIVERPLPPTFEGMLESHRVLMASDAAAAHEANFAERGELYPPRIAELIRTGQGLGAVDYVRATRHRLRLIAEMDAALADVDAAVMPAATGPAPEGLGQTGSRLFNVLSSFCGLPAVSTPMALSAQGLPLSLQLLGRDGADDPTLALAGWCESVLGFTAVPGRE